MTASDKTKKGVTMAAKKAPKLIKFTTGEIAALCRQLQKTARGITGNRIKVFDCTSTDSLAFTTGSEIGIGFNNVSCSASSKPQKISKIQGLFAHEILHCLLTDFNAAKNILSSIKSNAEKRIFHTIDNILEDAYIENFASEYLGDGLVRDLRFMRYSLYKELPSISDKKSAFEQFIDAMIQYKIGGWLKGNFSFPEARKTFAECVLLLDEGLKEKIPRRRSELSYKIFTISKPLWEETAKDEDALEELLKDLSELLRGPGNPFESPSGGGFNGSPLSVPETDGETPPSVKKRRRITFKKVTKEELEEAKKNSTPSSLSPEGDVTILYTDEETGKDEQVNKDGSTLPCPAPAKEPEEKETGSESSSSNSEDENDTSTDSSDKSEESNVSESTDHADNSENNVSSAPKNGSEESDISKSEEHSENSKNNSSDKNVEARPAPKSSESVKQTCTSADSTLTPATPSDTPDDEPIPSSSEMEAEIDHEEEFTEADAERVAEELASAMESWEREEREDAESADLPDNIKVTGGYNGVCNNASCLNVLVKPNNLPDREKLYEDCLTPIKTGVDRLTSQLKRIFRAEAEEKCYKPSGSLSIKRYSEQRITPNLCQRRRDPKNKSDIYVCLLIDESGSMCSGNKATNARIAAIGLAEVFNKLDIPISIIGFSADEKGADVVHYHYLNGKNSKRDRYKLLGIQARSDNFDGYTIRYAGKILKKKSAAHKLLIVVSDGCPAAWAYKDCDGVMDTCLAIKEVSKNTSVVGVLLGQGNPTVHKRMYGFNFLHIQKPQELFDGLANIIKRVIKGW